MKENLQFWQKINVYLGEAEKLAVLENNTYFSIILRNLNKCIIIIKPFFIETTVTT